MRMFINVHIIRMFIYMRMFIYVHTDVLELWLEVTGAISTTAVLLRLESLELLR